MKKILVLLVAMFLALPTFAVEAYVYRVVKEVNAATISKLSTDYSMEQYMTALYQEFNKDYYWRDGWNNIVRADVPHFLSEPRPQQFTAYDLMYAKPMLKNTYCQMFLRCAKAARQNITGNLKLEEVRKLKYGN